MSQHMVIFQNPDGDPGYNQFESIEDAVGFVEKLRNEQGIDSIRIFELEEVKFDLKPVYKVELQALNPGSSAPRPSAEPSAPPPAAPAAPQSAPAPAPAPPPSAPRTSPAPSPAAPSSAEPPSGSPFAPPSEPVSNDPAPSPPADQPNEDGQPARRGLFGR